MVGFDPNSKKELSRSEHALAGSFSGMVTRAIAQPLDVIKIRFQLQVEPIKANAQSKYHGMWQCTHTILREEGPTALWKGHVPAQALSVVFGAVQFISFEVLTKKMWQMLPVFITTDFKSFTHFVCGGIAGCCATLAAQPFDVIRTRFVAQGNTRVYNGVVHAAQSLVAKEGYRALYKGLLPTLIQVGPQTGLQFGFYSFFTGIWRFVFHPDRGYTGGLESLMCGSAAGLCAKVTVYPLDMIKKRLQIQGFQHGRPKDFGKTPCYRGLSHCVKEILRTEGIHGLYKGLNPSMVKAMVTVASHFYVYEQTCRLLLQWKR